MPDQGGSVVPPEEALEIKIGHRALAAAVEVQEARQGRAKHLGLVPLGMEAQELLQALEEGFGHLGLDRNLPLDPEGLSAAAAEVVEGKGHAWCKGVGPR